MERDTLVKVMAVLFAMVVLIAIWLAIFFLTWPSHEKNSFCGTPRLKTFYRTKWNDSSTTEASNEAGNETRSEVISSTTNDANTTVPSLKVPEAFR